MMISRKIIHPLILIQNTTFLKFENAIFKWLELKLPL